MTNGRMDGDEQAPCISVALYCHEGTTPPAGGATGHDGTSDQGMSDRMDISPRAILRAMTWLAAGITAAGLVIHATFSGGFMRFDELLITFAVTGCYVVVIWGALRLSGGLLTRRVPLDSRRAFITHAATQTLVTLLSLLLTSWLIHLVTGFTFMFRHGTMSLIGLVAFCGVLMSNGSYYLAGFYRRMREAEHAALRSELAALRAQVNPHFLFNALNSIAALIRSDPREAERVTESLADLFRYSLRSSRQPTVALAEEVESVELYAAIEQARFRHRLRITIDVPAQLRDARVPSLLLQPLVENAVKHGAGRTEGLCEVTIAAARRGSELLLRITDTGPGFPTTDLEQLTTMGSGLANVCERLRFLFGPRGTMTIERNGVGLSLPYAPIPAEPDRSSR